MQSNSLAGSAGPPSFAALNAGIRIRHREYIDDVKSSIEWKNTTYDIQPTDERTFPWLSQIASSFEQYKVHGMVFYYNSTSGNAISSTNNALGVVGLTTCYDPSLPAFGSKRQAEDYVGCTSATPAFPITHAVECKPKSDVLDRYYTLVDSISDDEDLKFYNHGKLNVFTQGMQQANVNLGELWISYDIEFFNPRVNPSGSDNQVDFYRWIGNVSGAYPLGVYADATPATYKPTFGNLGTDIYKAADGYNKIRFPQGSSDTVYLIVVSYRMANAFATRPTLNLHLPPNCASYSLFAGSTSGYFTIDATGSNHLTYWWTFTKKDLSQADVYLTGTGGFVGTLTANFLEYFVIPLSENFLTGGLSNMLKQEKEFERFALYMQKLGIVPPPKMLCEDPVYEDSYDVDCSRDNKLEKASSSESDSDGDCITSYEILLDIIPKLTPDLLNNLKQELNKTPN